MTVSNLRSGNIHKNLLGNKMDIRGIVTIRSTLAPINVAGEDDCQIIAISENDIETQESNWNTQNNTINISFNLTYLIDLDLTID